MEWSKIKNIIVILLLVVNAFLLMLVLGRETKSRGYEEQTRLDTIAILARSGISLDRALLPREMALTVQSVPRDEARQAAQAATLLGSVVSPDGDGTYTTTSGSLRFYSDGAFSFSGKTFPAGTVDNSHTALDLLAQLGIEAEVTGLSPDGDTVTASLLWDGTPVFAPSEITVRFEEGTPVSAEGYRLAGTPVPEASDPPLRLVTILLQLLEYIKANGIICQEITGITPGYSLNATQGGPPRLVPVWHITTDTGTYFLNAVTGAVV